MDGAVVGVFGTDTAAKAALETAVAKKSEAEGTVVFTRLEGGRRISLLDAPDFPDKLQGYARVASISDYAMYVYPGAGRLTPADGELALLLEAFSLRGRIVLLDGKVTPEAAEGSLAGTLVGGYPSEERSSSSSAVDFGEVSAREDWPADGTLVYVDRVFPVKGVGTVALGFVLSGRVAVHDQLAAVPGPAELTVEVKSVQVSDEDFSEAGRGIRVGLSLKGATADELGKCTWLAGPSVARSSSLELEYRKATFYKQAVAGRDLHLQLPGAMVPASLAEARPGVLKATLKDPVPCWKGMRAAVVDLNGKPLRVAGGATIL